MEFLRRIKNKLFGSKPEETPQFARLPEDVIPKKYNISIKTNFDESYFSGTQTVSLLILKPASEIIINSTDLEIQEAKLNSTLLGVVSYQKEEEKIVIKFTENIPAGDAELSLKFKGELLEASLRGYYSSKYKDPKGKERLIASTHFEPTSARRAFPCWDEPSFKATFIISLTVPDHMLAFSNMPEASRYCNEEEGYVRVVFQETLLMSTYLVAFAVGELEVIEKNDSNGLLIRVIAPLGKSIYGEYALDVACKTVPFLGEYFDHEFELPKIDLIAVPDFASGAMENWGLITFRETTLLINQEESTIRAKRIVGLIVCHELAHMWFGNVVTMKWWTDLWLKEGFATWLEYYSLDYCFPEHDVWSYNVSNDLVACMEVDALEHSHPIEVTVTSPAQINTIFDAISYMKGCAVIRMLNEYIGSENFRNGLRLYICRHQYSNAETADLWQALEEVSGLSVEEVMSTWTTKSGFPIIYIVPERNSQGFITSLNIRQNRYFTNGSHNKVMDSRTDSPPRKKRKLNPYLWHVPISIASLDKTGREIAFTLLTTESSKIKIEAKHITALRANPNACGYYRVFYDDETLFNDILQKVINQEIDVRDRLKFIEDYYSFGLSGTVSLSDVLDVIKLLVNETANSCWNVIRDAIYAVRNLLEDSEIPLDHLKQYVYKLFIPLLDRLGWDGRRNDSHCDLLVRSSAITILGRYGHPDVVKECNSKFANFIKNNKSVIEPNLHTAVFSTVAVNGTVKEINQLKTLFSKTQMQEEKVRILRALGFSPPEYHEEHIHSFILSTEVRMQDKLFGIICCCWCSKGRELAWTLIKDNWSKFTDSYRGKFLLHHLIEGVTKFASLSIYADDIERLLSEDNEVDRSLDQQIEQIRNNALRLERESEKVKQYLESVFDVPLAE